MVLYVDDKMDNTQKVTYDLQCVKLKEDRNALWERKSGPSSPRLHFQQWQEIVLGEAHEPGLSLQCVVFPSDCDHWIRDFRGYILACSIFVSAGGSVTHELAYC